MTLLFVVFVLQLTDSSFILSLSMTLLIVVARVTKFKIKLCFPSYLLRSTGIKILILNCPIQKYPNCYYKLILLKDTKTRFQEQPWPSGNALDSDQHGPGLEAQYRPLETSGRASGPKC